MFPSTISFLRDMSPSTICFVRRLNTFALEPFPGELIFPSTISFIHLLMIDPETEFRYVFGSFWQPESPTELRIVTMFVIQGTHYEYPPSFDDDDDGYYDDLIDE